MRLSETILRVLARLEDTEDTATHWPCVVSAADDASPREWRAIIDAIDETTGDPCMCWAGFGLDLAEVRERLLVAASLARSEEEA